MGPFRVSLLLTLLGLSSQIKEDIKALRHWPLCGNPLVTDGFPTYRGPINNIPAQAALLQIMACRRPGDKPLSELMLVLGDESSEDTPPMVAFMCGKPAMHRTPSGWVRDEKTDCLKDPNDILNYCKAMYPELDIKNVVEASQKETINDWCRAKHTHCRHHGSHTVRPFKCLVGPFQSEALLVPDHCVFDHFHDVTACKTFQQWNETSQAKCVDRSMEQQSFAILLPCQIDMFAGVEFVCCPREKDDVDEFLENYQLGDNSEESTSSESESLEATEQEVPSEEDDEYDEDWDDDYEEDDYSDEEDDEYFDDWSEEDEEDEDEAEMTTTSTTPAPAQPDKPAMPTDMYTEYLQGGRQGDNEHSYFTMAKSELQKHHHEKVTKMMKEWAAARQRVQEMKASDPKAAEKLNREITARFQKTYQALEQEGAAEKKQLIALHQQRVQADLNEKKRHAMEHYMSALQKGKPDEGMVLKALKHYIKCEQKDRLHSINHFKHLRDTDPAEAERIREQTLNHLAIIDQRIEQSREMLNRVPQFAQRVQLQIEDFLAQFRELDTNIATLLVRTEPRVEKPAASTDKQEPKQEAKTESLKPTPETEQPSTQQSSTEKDELYHVPLESEPSGFKPVPYDDEVMEDERAYVEIKPAHVARQSVNKLALKQSSYVKQSPADNSVSVRAGSTLGLAVGCIAVFVVVVIGIVVLRRKVQRRPVNHGFVEVDQAASPEERHVANMQINGYENPTYKYFEMSHKA